MAILSARRRRLALLPLLAAAAACASVTAAAPGAIVSATARADGLQIANHGDVTACCVAISRNALAYTDFVPADCDPARRTDVIAPGASVTRPWSSLIGAAGETEFVVMWWTGRPPTPGDPQDTGLSGRSS